MIVAEINGGIDGTNNQRAERKLLNYWLGRYVDMQKSNKNKYQLNLEKYVPLMLSVLAIVFLTFFYLRDESNRVESFIRTDLERIKTHCKWLGILKEFHDSPNTVYEKEKWTLGKDAKLLDEKLESILWDKDPDIDELKSEAFKFCESTKDLSLTDFAKKENDEIFLQLSNVQDKAEVLIFKYSFKKHDWPTIILSIIALLSAVLGIYTSLRSIIESKPPYKANSADAKNRAAD